jgi:hypothetical protein
MPEGREGVDQRIAMHALFGAASHLRHGLDATRYNARWRPLVVTKRGQVTIPCQFRIRRFADP